MEPLVKLAVAKALKDDEVKKASHEIKAGTGDVDITIHIKGTIQKGEDTERKDSLDYKHIASILASKLSDKKVEESLEEFFTQKVLMVPDKKTIEEFTLKVESKATTKQLPAKPVAGSVKALLSVEVVESKVDWRDK